MKRESVLAGVGALAFGILTIVAMVLSNPPGGNYKESDIADFLAKGHRPAVFVSVYVMLAAVAGLLLLLARLRDAIGGEQRRSLYWAFGVGAVAAWSVGYVVAVAPSLALAFAGGGLKLSPDLVYVVGEAGWGVMYGAGGLLLGCALLTFVSGAVAVPAWVRVASGIAGIAALAALAWFPLFLVYLWAIVMGVWALVADARRTPEATPATAPA